MPWKEVSFFYKRRIYTIIECVKCNFNDTKTTNVQKKVFILNNYIFVWSDKYRGNEEHFVQRTI